MASRRLADLTPSMGAKAFDIRREFDSCSPVGVTLLVYCTYRSLEEQAILYRKGRSRAAIMTGARKLETVYGKSDFAKILRDAPPQSSRVQVTGAMPGQGAHYYRLALDSAPIQAGHILWDDLALFDLYGEIAKEYGCIWGGDWKGKRRDRPHIQSTGFDWKELIKETI